MRSALAASSWLVVKSCAMRAVLSDAYATAMDVVGGCAMMNCFKSPHCDAVSLSMESSIKMARYSFSALTHFATCLRSLPCESCTSEMANVGGASFLLVAVTVMVDAPDSAATKVEAANAAIPTASRV